MNWQYEDGRIYYNNDEGELMAETTFVGNEDGVINIDHTYVNPALRGQGIAGKMMAVVAEHFKKEGRKVTATCVYAYKWLKKNEDTYESIMSENFDNQAVACKIDGRR